MRMKRKVFIVCISLLLLVPFGASSMVFDYFGGRNWCAHAECIGKNMSHEEIEKKASTGSLSDITQQDVYVRKVEKLTIRQEELVERELREYDVSPGEVYLVMLGSEIKDFYNMIYIFIRIDSISADGSFNYYKSTMYEWTVEK